MTTFTRVIAGQRHFGARPQRRHELRDSRTNAWRTNASGGPATLVAARGILVQAPGKILSQRRRLRGRHHFTVPRCQGLVFGFERKIFVVQLLLARCHAAPRCLVGSNLDHLEVNNKELIDCKCNRDDRKQRRCRQLLRPMPQPPFRFAVSARTTLSPPSLSCFSVMLSPILDEAAAAFVGWPAAGHNGFP